LAKIFSETGSSR